MGPRGKRLAILLASVVGFAPAALAQYEGLDPRYQSYGRDPMVTHSNARPGAYGGGFIEMLMTGRDPSQGRAAAHYQQPPAPRAAAPMAATQPYAAPPQIDPFTGEPMAPAPRRVAAHGQSDLFERPIERVMDARFRKQEVAYNRSHAPGTVVIDTNERFLYLVQAGGTAIRYGIGVGRPGFEWAGNHSITRKAEWPDWRPPSQMLKRRPDLPTFMAGGPDNPLGARAMYLGSTLYRIHGTNEPHTIGQAVSSGCIRMTNDDVTDLYGRVRVGTRVVVI